MWHKQSFTQFWSQSDAYSRRSSLKLTYIHHPLVVCTHQICCAVAVPIALSQDRLLHGHNRLVNWTPCSRMRESKLKRVPTNEFWHSTKTIFYGGRYLCCPDLTPGISRYMYIKYTWQCLALRISERHMSMCSSLSSLNRIESGLAKRHHYITYSAVFNLKHAWPVIIDDGWSLKFSIL